MSPVLDLLSCVANSNQLNQHPTDAITSLSSLDSFVVTVNDPPTNTLVYHLRRKIAHRQP